jgi:PPK2 family polyphosphate:nucleotide phosphotransferase
MSERDGEGKPSIRTALKVGAAPVPLEGLDPAGTPHGPKDKAAAAKSLADDAARLSELQTRLFAETVTGGTRSVLLVLQGLDTSGKGGVVTHVVGAFGPEGVKATAFKRPTPEEQAHHFLWRIRRALPSPGVIGVFDRSHYEDVLVTRVHETVPEAEWRRRYEEINAFEQELTDKGTVVVKCLLQISYAEQRERLLARLDDPSKNWKFSEHDVDERAFWADYQAAFVGVLENCSTEAAPWYVVPSDRKWYRNWAIGQLLLETLEEMDPHYPEHELDLPRLRARLQPPY